MFIGPGPKFKSSTNSAVAPQPLSVHGIYSLITTLPCPNEDLKKRKLVKSNRAVIWTFLVFKDGGLIRKIVTLIKKRKYPMQFLQSTRGFTAAVLRGNSICKMYLPLVYLRK